MPIVDSVKNRIISSLNEKEIRQKAEEIRFYANISADLTGNKIFQGHNALIDIAAFLYFNCIFHDPMNPFWDRRDRVFWSDAELAPLLYSTLGLCGYFPVEDLFKYRKVISSFDRYPDRFKVPGIEISVDSPGSGLGVAVGDALSAAMTGSSYKVFCIMSSAEQSLGTVWEAADSACRHRLSNLTAVIEESSSVKESDDSDKPESEQLADKYSSFGWHVHIADSRDHEKLLKIFTADRTDNLPTAVIVNNYSDSDESYSALLSSEIIKKNILSDENEQFEKKKSRSRRGRENKKKGAAGFPDKYGWNYSDNMKTEFRSMEEAVIRFIYESDAEKTKNCIFYSRNYTAGDFEKQYPGIGEIIKAEENIILTASGLAKEGSIPFIISRGSSRPEKNRDQLRNTVCLNNFNVKFIDFYNSYTETLSNSRSFALDNISAVQSIRNLCVLFPADALEAEKMISCAADIYGPVLIRIPCGMFPVVTQKDTLCLKGSANVIRYRGEGESFRSSFEIFRGSEYPGEKENISLIAAGRTVSEAMRSSIILKEEFGVEARVINAASVKPLDEKTILNAAFETGAVLVAGEADIKGFSDIIAASVLKNRGYSTDFTFACSDGSIRTDDDQENGDNISGSGISAEFISVKALELLNRRYEKNNSGGKHYGIQRKSRRTAESV